MHARARDLDPPHRAVLGEHADTAGNGEPTDAVGRGGLQLRDVVRVDELVPATAHQLIRGVAQNTVDAAAAPHDDPGCIDTEEFIPGRFKLRAQSLDHLGRGLASHPSRRQLVLDDSEALRRREDPGGEPCVGVRDMDLEVGDLLRVPGILATGFDHNPLVLGQGVPEGPPHQQLWSAPDETGGRGVGIGVDEVPIDAEHGVTHALKRCCSCHLGRPGHTSPLAPAVPLGHRPSQTPRASTTRARSSDGAGPGLHVGRACVEASSPAVGLLREDVRGRRDAGQGASVACISHTRTSASSVAVSCWPPVAVRRAASPVPSCPLPSISTEPTGTNTCRKGAS